MTASPRPGVSGARPEPIAPVVERHAMRPIPGADDPGETPDDRVAEQIARARRRRLATQALRQQMEQQRAHGLRARHANKEKTMTGPIDPAAVERGTYAALLDILDATGPLPTTRRDILDALSSGTQRALTEHLRRRGMTSGDDLTPGLQAATKALALRITQLERGVVTHNSDSNQQALYAAHTATYLRAFLAEFIGPTWQAWANADTDPDDAA